MKIGGIVAVTPTEEIVVFPRDPNPIVFRARAIPDMDEFFKLCPEPKAPGKLTKEGWVTDENEPGYRQLVASHANQRLSYMVIRTLEPSDIEWSTVKIDQPRTWSKWEEELRTVLTQIEVNRIVQLVLDANNLNEDKLVKAREVFLRGRVQAQSESSSHPSEPESSPSGELASE